MKTFTLAFLAACCAWALSIGTAEAQATTYRVSGPTLSVSNYSASPCVGNCRNPTTVGATGTLTLSAPFPTTPGLYDMGPLLTGYSLSAGGVTWAGSTATSTATNSRMRQFLVSVSAGGAYRLFSLEAHNIPSNTRFPLGSTDPDARLDRLSLDAVAGGAGTYAQLNAYCDASSGRRPDGACDGSPFGDRSSSVAGNTTPVALDFVSSEPVPVPTLSEWAMILFGTILAGSAALYVQRRRFTA